MLTKALSETSSLAEENGNVNALGVAEFVGKMQDIAIMLQRAFIKRTWNSQSDNWGRIPEFKVRFDGKDCNLHFTITGDEEECKVKDPDFDTYDVDNEPCFCVCDEESYFVEGATVATSTTGTKVDWGVYGHGTFILDGADPKNPAGSGYLHSPGNECVDQTLRGASW